MMKRWSTLILLLGMAVSFGASACEGSNHAKHKAPATSGSSTTMTPIAPAK
jgi:hypothetical protein